MEAAVAKFEPKQAALRLEEEIREAVLGTVGSAVGELALLSGCSPPDLKVHQTCRCTAAGKSVKWVQSPTIQGRGAGQC